MKAILLIEKIGKRKYRASTAQPIAMEAEGRTREEAIDRLCEEAQGRLGNGELVQVSFATRNEENPWIAYAGIWKDHPDFKEFKKNIADYCRELNKS